MRACPFCNYDEGWIKEIPSRNKILFRVECKVCGSSGPKATTHKMAEWKWNGFLSKIKNVKNHIDNELEEDDSDPYEDMYMNEDIGGVSAPMTTLANTPGVGDVTPASQAAVTGSDMNSSDVKGSGDKFGDSIIKKKRKKRKLKNKK